MEKGTPGAKLGSASPPPPHEVGSGLPLCRKSSKFKKTRDLLKGYAWRRYA